LASSTVERLASLFARTKFKNAETVALITASPFSIHEWALNLIVKEEHRDKSVALKAQAIKILSKVWFCLSLSRALSVSVSTPSFLIFPLFFVPSFSLSFLLLSVDET
jgi:hypothetical protein